MINNTTKQTNQADEQATAPVALDTTRLYLTSQYHEDFGNCLFFHFDGFEGPPDVYCGSPLEVYPPFDVSYWTHFVRFDFNSVIATAMHSPASGRVS